MVHTSNYGVNAHYPPPPNSLLEILSFTTSHYATSMQLVVICNYLDHVYNCKFGIV